MPELRTAALGFCSENASTRIHEPVTARAFAFTTCRHCGTEITDIEGKWYRMVPDSPEGTQVGVTDRPDPSAAAGNGGRAATAGADRPIPKTAIDDIRKALTILNAAGQGLHAVASIGTPADERLDVGFRRVDVDAARELLTCAIVQVEQLRATHDRLLASNRRLESAIGVQETFIVTLSDGALLQYFPRREDGSRWTALEPVPSTRADVLAEGQKS